MRRRSADDWLGIASTVAGAAGSEDGEGVGFGVGLGVALTPICCKPSTLM
jgi:hypothetical protein